MKNTKRAMLIVSSCSVYVDWPAKQLTRTAVYLNGFSVQVF
jgi:hypothetical protein